MPPTAPVAVVFSARLLLTEKSSVTGESFLSDVRVEVATVQPAVMVPVKSKLWERHNRGYVSGGIND